VDYAPDNKTTCEACDEKIPRDNRRIGRFVLPACLDHDTTFPLYLCSVIATWSLRAAQVIFAYACALTMFFRESAQNACPRCGCDSLEGVQRLKQSILFSIAVYETQISHIRVGFFLPAGWLTTEIVWFGFMVSFKIQDLFLFCFA
jgi:hypothetical protein